MFIESKEKLTGGLSVAACRQKEGRMILFRTLSSLSNCPLCVHLIGMEGAKTPAGSAGQARPRRKRSAWNGKQQPSSAGKPKKTAGILSVFLSSAVGQPV
ncbi:Ribose 5-phosphate isomerase B [Bacillus badius]|nr:Ribose 5-phosphate isomerase B [Bacillus badius]